MSIQTIWHENMIIIQKHCSLYQNKVPSEITEHCTTVKWGWGEGGTYTVHTVHVCVLYRYVLP